MPSLTLCPISCYRANGKLSKADEIMFLGVFKLSF